MVFFISKCEQIRSFLQICSHLLKKLLMGNFSLYALIVVPKGFSKTEVIFSFFEQLIIKSGEGG